MAYQLDTCIQRGGQVFEDFYNRIKSAKSLSFWMTTFSSSLTYLRVLLLQGCDFCYYASRRILTSASFECINALMYAHTISQTFPTCDSSLSLLTLRAPEPGDFVASYYIICKPPAVLLNTSSYANIHLYLDRFCYDRCVEGIKLMLVRGTYDFYELIFW